QIWSGDFSARSVAKLQPAKLAAMEANYQTQIGAPLRLGGIPDDESRTNPYAITIPRGLSLLSTHDPNAKVIGLEEFPRNDWPNVRVVHTLRLRHHGRSRNRVACLIGRLRHSRVEAPRPARWEMDSAGDRGGRAIWLSRDRSRLDRDRSRPSALDHLQRHAHRGRGNADEQDRDSLRRLHRSLPFSLDRSRLPPAPSVHGNRRARGSACGQHRCLSSSSPGSCSRP
ncbi:MAG: cytochrome ubiquinol oxidase subunit I, partial [Chthoniobacterales bacterium]|nr:cytochrome ubiquinol oxidase subunit I [Chthoniobacterales bacterium]